MSLQRTSTFSDFASASEFVAFEKKAEVEVERYRNEILQPLIIKPLPRKCPHGFSILAGGPEAPL